MCKNLKKIFHGWVRGAGRARIFGSAVGLRHALQKNPSGNGSKPLERFIYVGCVHGGNERIYERLEAVLKSSDIPDYLIFSGDITGSQEFEKLKKWFYDEKEAGKNDLQKFDYFGDWATTLPREKREELLKSIKYAAQSLSVLLKRLQEHRIKILIVEGNWDNPKLSGVNLLKGNDIKDNFDTSSYLRSHGFQLIDKLKYLETKTAFHVFLPYKELLEWDNPPSPSTSSGFGEAKGEKRERSKIRERVLRARKKGKTIVMVGHAEANWRLHHLDHPQHLSGERARVVDNFAKAMALFHPDEVIYPHQHSRIRDEKGNLVGIDEKYLLHITHDGVRLVEDVSKEKNFNGDILATYIPFGNLAQEDF